MYAFDFSLQPTVRSHIATLMLVEKDYRGIDHDATGG